MRIGFYWLDRSWRTPFREKEARPVFVVIAVVVVVVLLLIVAGEIMAVILLNSRGSKVEINGCLHAARSSEGVQNPAYTDKQQIFEFGEVDDADGGYINDMEPAHRLLAALETFERLCTSVSVGATSIEETFDGLF